MAALLQLLHLFSVLIMSSKAACRDSWQERPSYLWVECTKSDLRPCSSVDLESLKDSFLLRDVSSAMLPNVFKLLNLVMFNEGETYGPLSNGSASLPSLEVLASHQGEKDVSHQMPVKKRFSWSHKSRALLFEFGHQLQSLKGPLMVQSTPTLLEMSSPPKHLLKSPAPRPSSRSRFRAMKKHHHRHPHLAFPPVSSSPEPRKKNPSPHPPFVRLPPLTHRRRPVPHFVPPHMSPSPTRQRRPPVGAMPPRSSPRYHRNANAPVTTPTDHRSSAPHSAPPNIPPVSVGTVPVPSSRPPPNMPPVSVGTAPVPSSQPPPIEDCGAVVCLPPLTKTAFMSPCGCVRPIQVQLQLTIPLYALFPSISVLAANIADGIVLAPSQVEITGANADSDNPDYSIVVVNLVPLDPEFDNLTAFLIFQKLWKHEVALNTSLFGNYSVLYVHYPGLPPSPPSEVSIGGVNGTGGNSSQDPFGVDVKQKGHKLGLVIIVVIALVSSVTMVACLGALWFFFRRRSRPESANPKAEPKINSSRTKRSGGRSLLFSDHGSSRSNSLSSSMATYASSARTFALAELEKATGSFSPENVIGEGGFGRVFSGTLDDGTKLAVKVLTRDQGGKEFISEVEMLSRLHHRNLVKLLGICTEEHTRCLVYELIPNGSVESHLHGVDKDSSPLDWKTRMKIALGAARGLAYLHEDSNPRVIHRDFKASNILLENDFTPKVSDFGLAKVAPDEGREHLSTRVMGTFGYVAPEYAMTGHLLVKSDVYSYGVVLLELLSGRQPVDILKPPGQANLVTWARPLLTTREGLELLVDPALGGNFLFDNLVRVAAIASMCVHPEVSHRPFMGEVVQALKLVYNDTEVHNGIGSSNVSQEDDSFIESTDAEQVWLDQKAKCTLDGSSFISVDYDSGPSQVGNATLRRPLSANALFPDSLRFFSQSSKIFRRHSLSGPLKSHTSKFERYKLRTMNRQGSISEHVALSRHFGTGLNRTFHDYFVDRH